MSSQSYDPPDRTSRATVPEAEPLGGQARGGPKSAGQVDGHRGETKALQGPRARGCKPECNPERKQECKQECKPAHTPVRSPSRTQKCEAHVREKRAAELREHPERFGAFLQDLLRLGDRERESLSRKGSLPR